ncbi:MAG TPA: hypothetical protein VMW24_01635 [Sedimentisphaerales bacterium]|nr:hypothetical protein [Sedimentisphaerales bacterium]
MNLFKNQQLFFLFFFSSAIKNSASSSALQEAESLCGAHGFFQNRAKLAHNVGGLRDAPDDHRPQ